MDGREDEEVTENAGSGHKSERSEYEITWNYEGIADETGGKE
jgi:hypothetical protein